MTQETRILLIEDDPAHVLLCQHALTAEQYNFKVKVATLGQQALAWLAESASQKDQQYDVIVLDNKLPDYYGLDLLVRIKECTPNSLVIMVTGYRDDELALEALRRGAIDYLPKTQDYHKHLPRIIQLNIERSTLYASIQKLNELETRYRLLIETAQDAILTIDQHGHIQLVNRIAEFTFGYRSEEILGKPFRVLLPERVLETYLKDRSHGLQAWLSTLTGKTIELTGVRKERDEFPLELSLSCCEVNNQLTFTAIVRDITERKRLEEALRILNNRIVNAQEEERKRISRELHDEIGQSLATINIGLQLIRDKVPESNKHIIDDLEEAIGDIKHVIRSLRELSSHLHPHIIDDLGLVPAIRWLANEVSERSSITVNLMAPYSMGRYSPDVELLMFRICQESLTNVVKHAQADRVDISIERTATRLRLLVQDNGRGFNIEEKTKLNGASGVGLVGMKERAASIGGKFNITSSRRKGTKVLVTIPITVAKKGDGERRTADGGREE
jgi:PAS domain S-box-containing protein